MGLLNGRLGGLCRRRRSIGPGRLLGSGRLLCGWVDDGGGGGFVWFVGVGRGLVGVVGDLADHFVLVEIEADAADVADGSVEGAEDEFSALEFEGATEQSVDDFHEGGLDGFGVFEQGGAKNAGAGEADERRHPLVEVAELLSASAGEPQRTR